MSNLEHLKAALGHLEAEHGREQVYDFCSGFHDTIVLGHSPHPDDNPHLPDEQPAFELYRLGARTADGIRKALHKCKTERIV